MTCLCYTITSCLLENLFDMVGLFEYVREASVEKQIDNLSSGLF